jgi:hypothetical protein
MMVLRISGCFTFRNTVETISILRAMSSTRLIDLQRDGLRALIHWFFLNSKGQYFNRRQIADSILMHYGLDPEDQEPVQLKNFNKRLSRALRRMVKQQVLTAKPKRIAAGYIENHYGIIQKYRPGSENSESLEG